MKSAITTTRTRQLIFQIDFRGDYETIEISRGSFSNRDKHSQMLETVVYSDHRSIKIFQFREDSTTKGKFQQSELESNLTVFDWRTIHGNGT
jgi:hypothetical protein